jgi:hypothetical protein
VTSTATRPAARHAPRRAPRGARRAGYVLGAAINLLLLWLVTVHPGWRFVPVLTEDFVDVVGVVIASLLVGAAINLLYVAADPRWLKHLGEAVTAAFGCVVLARMWAIFPIDLGARWGGWEPALRVVIGLFCLGAGIAVVANLALAVRAAVGDLPAAGSTPPASSAEVAGQTEGEDRRSLV